MAASRGAATTSPSTDDAPPQRRRRNAERTRQLLLDKARWRFARDGYAATTVRDIADDAGVNVALINRYFTSKEGLFEACLRTAGSEMRQDADDLTFDGIAAAMASRIAGASMPGEVHDALLLLLRTSGDERIDELRRAVLQSVSEKLARAANGPDISPEALLRAQVVLGTTLGITLLRASMGLQPLAEATPEDLLGPLTDLVNALLPVPR
ncbi:TetR/AcrR family transcriptional regulator [Actinoplanes sp. N902-109]|uniref:TetR/AcrR family transcriptional regulator n=1 Tax=Actinoplanes sp. (strain N902-109) TaxID=649831 RepID=UPI0003293930|nr:TetR/AcrR family transcriptional regulator [Actinoplanes sp. N902-109]AGL17220.1 TetR family transcriptional regulator [Actinoplanes sp. N902-109]